MALYHIILCHPFPFLLALTINLFEGLEWLIHNLFVYFINFQLSFCNETSLIIRIKTGFSYQVLSFSVALMEDKNNILIL